MGTLTECRWIGIGGRIVCVSHATALVEDDNECVWRTLPGRGPVCITAGHQGHGQDTKPLSPEAQAWLAETEKHPEIIKGKTLIKGVSTDELYMNADGTWKAERVAQMHEPILATILNNPAATPEPGTRPILVLYAGAGGSGKTTALGQYLPGEGDAKAKAGRFITINADDVKDKLPEYTGYNAALVHEESAHIAENLALKAAMRANRNVLFDGTGKTAAKYLDIARDARALGYDVHLMYSSVESLTSTQRAVSRFLKMVERGDPKPRYVDPSYLLRVVDAKPDKTYTTMKASGLIDRAVKVDNNGTAPRLVEDVRLRPTAESSDGPRGLPGMARRPVAEGTGRREEGKGGGGHLSEADDDDCRWRTIGGNRVCITAGHTTGGFAGASGKPVYYHGGQPIKANTPEAQTVALLDRLTKPDGGFTYDPKTESEPTAGYVVATHPDRSKIFDAATLTKEDLVDYVDANWDLLQQPGEHLGAWHDPKTGKAWLDVSRVVSSRTEAERLAREHKQIAFFDLKGGTSIPTPGGHRFLGLSNLTRKIHETGRDLLTHVAAGTVLAVAAGGLHALAAYRDLRGQ